MCTIGLQGHPFALWLATVGKFVGLNGLLYTFLGARVLGKENNGSHRNQEKQEFNEFRQGLTTSLSLELGTGPNLMFLSL